MADYALTNRNSPGTSSKPVQVDCTIIDIPRGATMVIGSRVMVADQDGLDMMLDLSNY